MFKSILIIAAIVGIAVAAIPDEDWAYVPVRPNANVFWWLYGKDDNQSRSSSPLVIWLQGGPGGSSCGFGNFLEIGPLAYLNNGTVVPRAASWTRVANLLFIDQPVGTGFSWVSDPSGYTTNEDQIASDLIALMKSFLSAHPEFQTLPVFIFSESYGGKMAASFAKAITTASKKGQLKINFQGVAMGDSWIKPIAFVNTWGPYLYNTAEVDENGLQQITAIAKQCDAAVKSQQWANATDLWNDVENTVEEVSANVNFYNILQRDPNAAKKLESGASKLKWSRARRHLNNYHDPDLTAFMNGPIRQKLGIIPANVSWGAQADDVFTYLSVDFMQEVVSTVDWLLNNNVNVIVYSGNLDLICCTIGTWKWMNDLTWNGYKSWTSAAYNPITVDGQVALFEKTFKNLRFYEVLSAGHMVPSDQPDAALELLTRVLNGN